MSEPSVDAPANPPGSPEPLAPRLEVGRVFSGVRKVRLGDVDRAGRLRFDALTRYTQDVSDDDTTDAGLDPEPAWVVRSTVVDEVRPAALAERLTFDTFCAGLGTRWAERRLSVRGEGGAVYEVSTIWVCIDPVSGRPHRLTDQFLDLYGEAAGGRRVSARLVNPGPPTPPTDADRTESASGLGGPWRIRAADLDIYDHVNNAAYWAAVEQWLPESTGPRRIRLEYGSGLTDADDPVVIAVADHDGGRSWWWRPSDVAGVPLDREPAASARLVPFDG